MHVDAQEIFKEREKKSERKKRGRGAEKNKREGDIEIFPGEEGESPHISTKFRWPCIP